MSSNDEDSFGLECGSVPVTSNANEDKASKRIKNVSCVLYISEAQRQSFRVSGNDHRLRREGRRTHGEVSTIEEESVPACPPFRLIQE